MTTTSNSNEYVNSEYKKGAINALCAYTLWGLAPIYFKLLSGVSAPEILVHRIIWSFILLVIIIVAMGKWRKVQEIIKQPKIFFSLALSSILLGFNWLVFIWAINNNHILEASLGYYINPLFNVVLGMIFFSERLSKWKTIAVLLALTGVAIQIISLGSVPLVALSLAASFGIYGLIRKKVPVDSLAGLLIESAWLLPLAIGYWYGFVDSETGNMFNNETSLNVALLAAGIVTTAPLLFFTGAAKRLPLATLGFFQYLGPSLMFIVAISFYNELIVFEKLVTFAFIWCALIVFSLSSIKKKKSRAIT